MTGSRRRAGVLLRRQSGGRPEGPPGCNNVTVGVGTRTRKSWQFSVPRIVWWVRSYTELQTTDTVTRRGKPASRASGGATHQRRATRACRREVTVEDQRSQDGVGLPAGDFWAAAVDALGRPPDEESEAVTLGQCLFTNPWLLRPDEDQWQEEKGESDW